MLTKEKDQDTDLTNEVRGEKIGEMPNESGIEREIDGSGPLSFLGERPRIPPLPDSPEPSDLSKREEHQSVAEFPFGIKDSPVDGVEQDSLPPQVNTGPKFPPTVNSSPTAVPFAYRRNHPSRPPMQSRTKIRPRSTGFRSSEFIPLYLVARHTPRQEPSIEKCYSLPSSHSTSRTSSIQDPEEYNLERGPNQIDALDLVDPIVNPHSEGRGLLIDTQRSLQGLDLLDSAQPTPTAHSFQAGGQRDTSPQAKTRQDLESALVALPLLPSPSYTNFKHDPSFTSQYRSQELICDRTDFSSDNGWKKNIPEHPFKLTEDLPPLPSSRASSPDSVSEPNSLETIIQPILHSKHEFELPDDLPPLPSNRASSPDLDDKPDEPNKNPQPILYSTENEFVRIKNPSDLSSNRPLSPDPCIEPAEQRFLSPSKLEFDIPEDLPSLPSSRVSSPELGNKFEEIKSTPQFTRDVEIPGDLPPLPRSRTPTPDLDAQLGQSISLPQLIRAFEPPRNSPALPSNRDLSPDNDIKSGPEPKKFSRPAYSFQAPEDMPTLPGCRASSPDLDAERRNCVSIRQPVNEFEQFEDLPALPSSRASSPDADARSNLEFERGPSPQPMFGLDRSENLPSLPISRASSPDFDADFNVQPIISPRSAFEFQTSKELPALPSGRASSPAADTKSNLEIERKTSPQPIYGLERPENPPPLPGSRASSRDFNTGLNVEPIISLQSAFEFEPSDDLPALPSSRASSPDVDVFHDVEPRSPLEPTLEFSLSEDLPALPSSRASSPDADTFHDLETKIPLEITLESHGSENFPVLPVSRAPSLEAYSTHDIKTKIHLEATFEFQGSENLPRLPSSRSSSPDSDTYHDAENKTPLQPANLIQRLEDLPALPPSRASSPNSSNETEQISNKMGPKLMTEDKIVPNLGSGLGNDAVTGAINAEIAESSKAPTANTLQSPDLLTSKKNSVDDSKDDEPSLQRQSYVENANPLSTPENGNDIESTSRLQSLSSGTLIKGMTADEVVAVMAAVAEGANNHEKRPTATSKKARRNQKKAKQEDRPQASINEASDRASVQQQEGMEDDLISQSFASKDPNMPSGKDLVDATDLSIPVLGTELSRGENIQIEENAPPVKKGKKGKKNEKRAVQTSPNPKSRVTDDSSTQPGPQAARAAVLTPSAGDLDMEGAQMGGLSVETVDQKLPKATSQSETPSQAVSLPIDDDLELLEAPPPSPSVRPSDRSSLPDSFPETTPSPIDNYQKTVLEAKRPVKLTSDSDIDLLAPTHYDETTDRGRYQSRQPKNKETHEPFSMVPELHYSASGPDIVPELVESTARDDLDQVETSPQSAVLEKADETSHEQGQVKESLSKMPNSPITESLKPDLEHNLAAQFAALPPNDDLDLLEASPPKPTTELTRTQWLEQPEPLINESPEAVPAHEITPRARPLPNNDDFGLQKASPRSPSVGSTEQRSYRPELSEHKRSEEIESFTQLSKEASVLAPEFIALPSDTDPDLLESSPRMASVEPQLNAQLDESQDDAEAGSPRSPDSPIIPAEDITTMADYDLNVLEQDLPSPPKQSSSTAEEPIAKIPKNTYELQPYPETVALPVNDDLDLLKALPPSPPTDSQPELSSEPSLRSPTRIFGPNITPDIFVSPSAKGFRSPSAPPTSSFAGQMPTIPEEVLEQEAAPENFTLPSDDDLNLVEEIPASPLADPMVSQLETSEEPQVHSSRMLNETEVTPHIIPEKELDLPGSLPPSPLSNGIDEPAEETLEVEVNPGTIKLPDDEDLDLLEALPPSPSSDTNQVPQVGFITLPETLPSSLLAEQISRSPKELLERNVSPEISEIPADEDLDSKRAIPPSSPVDSLLNRVKEQNFRLPEDFLASEVTPDVIALPADKDFDLLEALPPNTWAGSQQSSSKEASSTSLRNIPEAKDVTQKIRDDHDLAEALPPSASDERMAYQPDQHAELCSRSLMEPSELEPTPQAVELPYDDDLDLMEALPPSPLASPTPELESLVGLPPSPIIGSKEHHVGQLEYRITKSLEPKMSPPQSLASRSIESKDHAEPAEELVSKSLEVEVNPESSKFPVSDTLDLLNTLLPSTPIKLTEHRTRSTDEAIPTSPEIAPSTVFSADGDPGLLEPRPEIFSADHQTRSIDEAIPTPLERAPSTVACADGDSDLLEPRPEILSTDHQTRSLEDPIPKLLELAPSTVACADGDLGVSEARPEIFSIDQSSQQTDPLDERISKWQNELVAESQLPPESIQLPVDEGRDLLAALSPSPTKSIIPDGVELRPLGKATQPEAASPHALEPLKEIDSQALPQNLPLPADDGLDLLEAQPESPLSEPQVVPKDFPLPTDDDLDLLEALPESPLSEPQVVPKDLPLPTDDDLDLSEGLPDSPFPECQAVPKDFPLPTDDDLDLLEELPESPLSESQVIPEDLPLPTDDDLDLLEGLPDSPLPESQVVPKDFPLPTDDDLDLLEELPESPLSESQVIPEDLPLPTDDDLDLLEDLPDSPLPEPQVVPKDFPLPTDDDLDLLEELPESPLSESQVIPEDLPLPTDDDLDLLEGLPDSPLPETQVVPKDFPLPTDDDLDLLEELPESPLSESQIIPEDLPLPTDDDLDLLEGLPDSRPLPESQAVPKDFPLPTDDDLDLLGELPESPLPEPRAAPEDLPLPTGNDLDLLEAPPKSSLPESQIAPKDLPLPTDDDLDLLDALPESPLLQSSTIDSDNLGTQHLEAKEHDPDAHHNPVIPGLLEPEVAPENLQLPANDDLDLETSPQSPMARSINPENKDIAPLEIEDLLKEEVKGEVAEEFGGPNDNAKEDTDKLNEDVGKKDKKSAITPIFPPIDLETKPLSIASEGIENIASEPKEDTSAREVEEGKDGVVYQLVAEADEETGPGMNKRKKEKKSKSGAATPSVVTSTPKNSLLSELPTKSIGGAVSEVLMQDKIKKVPSEQPEILNNDGGFSKKSKKRTTKKGKKIQEESSNSGLILEEVESPKALVATLPLGGSNETTELSENLVRNAGVESFQGRQTIEDEWPQEPKKKGKNGRKAQDNSPPLEGSAEATEPPSFETTTCDLDFEDSQAQAVTEDERQKEPKKMCGKGKKSKDKNSKPSIKSPGLPPMTSPASPIDDSSSTDAAQVKVTTFILDHSTDTRDETSSEDKVDEAGMKQISSLEDTGTAELQLEAEPKQGIREEALLEETIDDEPAELVRDGNKGKEGMNLKRGSKDDATTLAEVTRNELGPTQTMPELESELPIPDEVRPKEDEDQHIGAQQIVPENIAPDLSFAKFMESGQVEPDHLESGLTDLEEPQPAQTPLAEIKDPASGEPKSQLMEENPAEISLKIEPEPIEKENFTFNAASPVQEIGGSTPTPQEPDKPELISEEDAAPVDSTTRKTPSSTVDSQLPLDLQIGEHSPTPEKNLTATIIMTPISDVENSLLDTKDSLPLIPEPAAGTQLPPSTDQNPSVLETSPFPATGFSFTEPLEKSPITAEKPSVRGDSSIAETLSSENPSVTTCNPALRPLSADTYPLPAEELSILGSLGKAPAPSEEPVEIEPRLSGKPLIGAEEVPVIDLPSVDEFLATAKELALFESHHSPDHVQESPAKDLDVSPADKSMIGFEEPSVRDMVSPDKYLPAAEAPSVMEVLSPGKALATLEEPAGIDAPSSNKSLVHVEEPSVTESGPPQKSAIPVQESSATESPASGKSSPTMQKASVATAEESSILDASSSVPEKRKDEPEPKQLDEEPTKKAKKGKEGTKGSKARKQEVGEPEQREDDSTVSEKQDQVEGPVSVDQVTPDNFSVVTAIQGDRLEETPIATSPITPEGLPSAVLESQVGELEQLEDDPIAPDYSSAVKKTKKGKKGKKQGFFDETDQPEEDLIIPEERSAAPEKQEAEPDQFGKKTKKRKKGKSKRQRLHDLPEEGPVTPEDTSAPDLKQTDQLDRPEEDPVISEDHSALDTKQMDQFHQPEEDPVISRNLSAIHTKQIDPLDQQNDPIISEDLSALIVDKLNQIQEDLITSEELSAPTISKLDHPKQESIRPEELSTVPTIKSIDEYTEDPISSEDLATNSKSKKGDDGEKARKRGVDEPDQLQEPDATEYIDTILARQVVELDQPKEPIAAKEIGPASSKQLEPIISEGIPTAAKTEKNKKGKKAKNRDDRGLEGPEDESIASEYCAAVIEAIEPEEPTANETKDAGDIQPEAEEFDRLDEDPVAVKSPAILEKKKSKRDKNTRQEDVDSAEHEPFVPEDTFPPLEDYELDQPDLEAIASADVAAALKAKKSKKGKKKKHVDRLGPSDQTFLAPEDASTSQDELLDRQDQSTIASGEKAVSEEQSVEIPLKKKIKKGKNSKQYENFDRSDKGPITPEETIASLENLPDVLISKEIGQDDESIQTSLAPIISGDTDTPQEDISAVPKNNRGKEGRKPKQGDVIHQSNTAGSVASGDSLTMQEDFPNSKEEAKQDARLDQTELEPRSPRDLPEPLVSRNSTQDHERNGPGPEPSDEASAIQEDFPESAVAKRQMDARAISEETIATSADTGRSEVLPDDTRDQALTPISQKVSENISKPQAEPQHEESKEAEAGQQRARNNETPAAEDSHMNNPLDVSLGVQAEEAILQDHLVKPQAEREFEDAGIRGEDNSLLIEGYREATHSDPSHEHPKLQREQLADAVQALPTPATLDSMPSDVPIQLQSESQQRELADRNVELTYPIEILTSDDANAFIDPEKDKERRLIAETSQTVHPSDGIVLSSTPLLVIDSAEPQDSKGPAEEEQPKSPGLTVRSSDIDLNRPTHSESPTEPEKSIPDLPPIDPAFEKSTPVEELGAPGWGLKPAKKSRKKKSKKKTLDSNSLNTGEILDRGSSEISEEATVAGDLDFKPTERLEEDLPEISLTEADVAKSTPVEELSAPEWGLTPVRKSKKEKKSKKKALDSDSSGRREVLEPGSADISEGAALAGDLDLKLTGGIEEDLPEITPAEADVEKSTPVEELSVPEWELTPARKSKKEKKSKKKALDSDSSSRRDVLEPGSADISGGATLAGDLDLKLAEKIGEDLPEITLAEADDEKSTPVEELSVPGWGLTPARKSKKEKKSRKKALDSDSSSRGEVLEPRSAEISEGATLVGDLELKLREKIEEDLPEITLAEADVEKSTPAEELSVPEWGLTPARKSKKEKSKKKALDNDSLTTGEILEREPGDIPEDSARDMDLKPSDELAGPKQDMPEQLLVDKKAEESIPVEHSAINDLMSRPSKKGKKDKKSKGRASDSIVTEEILDPAASKTIAMEAAAEQNLPELLNMEESIPNDDSTRPESGINPLKKSKKRVTASGSLVPEASELLTETPKEQILPEILNADGSISIGGSKTPESGPLPSERSKKDKETKNKPIVNSSLATKETLEPTASEIPTGIPEEQVIYELSSTKKNRKCKNNGKQNLEIDRGPSSAIRDNVERGPAETPLDIPAEPTIPEHEPSTERKKSK